MSDRIRAVRTEVLTYLIRSNSMTKISTAAIIDGSVHKDYIVIHEACARVVREVIAQFPMVSLTANGLLIPVE